MFAERDGKWSGKQMPEESNFRKTLDKIPSPIECIIFDFDGVFTNNQVIVNEHGVESVICNRSDGLAVSLLKQLNIPMTIISTEKNPVVSMRAQKLDIPLLQGVDDKKAVLLEFAKEQRIDLGKIIYVGNDLNDLECMKVAGVVVVPSDANNLVKDFADIVLDTPGGKGAVMELAGYILKKVGKI